MPVIKDPRPVWAKPEQASVLESPLMKAMRILASVVGSGDLAGQAMGAVGPMPMIATVPKESAEVLVPRLLKNWEAWAAQNGQTVPENVRAAVDWLVQKFPRMASHLDSVNRLAGDTPRLRGMFHDNPAVGLQGRRAGEVYINEALNPRDALQALVHETTHGAQALRQGTYRVGGKPELYTQQTATKGYFQNPYEVQARIAQLNQYYKEIGLGDSAAKRLAMAAHDAQLEYPGTSTTQGWVDAFGRGVPIERLPR